MAGPPQAAWAKQNGQRPLYTRYSLDTVYSSIHFFTQKAITELGYAGHRVQATVRDTVAWLLEAGAERQSFLYALRCR